MLSNPPIYGYDSISSNQINKSSLKKLEPKSSNTGEIAKKDEVPKKPVETSAKDDSIPIEPPEFYYISK